MAMYIPTIGLEIHANVKTRTKMFCACKNDLEEKQPNTNVCPVCLGHPGVLPTINREAVAAVMRLGLGLKAKIAEHSHFDRKSYFYPDLPKGYQISQYEDPLVQEGMLNDIRIKRVHLEEDAGRLVHAEEGSSLVDFNRAGVPLLELVTEPDITSAEQAVAFAKALQRTLRYLDVSDADMEKGQMRVEANISIREATAKELGVKVEVKNINSFKAVQGAIEYEVKRHTRLLEEGGKIVQETRGWNDQKNITESQRSKESAHDYRYFPEPDLPPLDLKEFGIETIKAHLPELPDEKRERFVKEFGIPVSQVEQLIDDKRTAEYFEETASELKELASDAPYTLLANYFTSDLAGLMKEKGIEIGALKVSPEHLAHFIALIAAGKLSSRLAKNLLVEMFMTGEDPETLMQKSGVRVMGDADELGAVIDEVILKNEKSVKDFKGGKQNALQFLIGQAMARTKGQADPGMLKELFIKKLS